MEQYFAKRSANELASHLQEKTAGWVMSVESNGLKSRWNKCHKMYYGKHYDGSYTDASSGTGILSAGEQGEYKLLTTNHFRNLLKHVLVMTTSQRPSFDVRATNTDTESLNQARLANSIVDYYLRTKRIGRYLKSAAEHALVFGKGFIEMTWESSEGMPYTTEPAKDENGQPIFDDSGEPVLKIYYEGDVRVRCPSVYDVYTDPDCDDWYSLNWYCSRRYENRYDLAARYPQLKSEIEGLANSEPTGLGQDHDSDLVPVYYFYHKRSPAMPNGRLMIYCDDSTVVYDGPIPYSKLPLFRIVPGEIFGTTEGYSDGFDLIACQEALSAVNSTILSNINAYGMQNIINPQGNNLNAEQLSQNLRVLNYKPTVGKPEVLQLLQIPPQLFDAAQMYERTLETLSGVNSVARGNPDDQLKSGRALGIVQSMAVQFSSGFQESWAYLFEDVGTFLIDLLKEFARTKRMISIAGRSNRASLKYFTSEDLSNVDRVVVDLGNPLSRTLAGRKELADNFLERGFITTPEGYLSFMETGQLEQLTESQTSKFDLVKAENQKMLDGEPVLTLITDPHVLHMKEHISLLSNPDIRKNPQLVQMVTNHYMEHKQMYEGQDQITAMINGEPPAPQPPPMPPPPPGPQAGPPPPPPGPGPNLQPTMGEQVPMPAI